MTERLDEIAVNLDGWPSEPMSAELAVIVDNASQRFAERMLAEFEDGLPKGLHPLSKGAANEIPSKI